VVENAPDDMSEENESVDDNEVAQDSDELSSETVSYRRVFY
jgi:hypothetical protein